MRVYFILILTLFCTQASEAQQYCTILKTSEAYYTNEQGRIRAIKLDSIVALGQDSLLYNYPNIRNVENSQCYTLQGGSWIGRYVLQMQGGEEIYFNKNGDTILFKPRAAKGTNWICYNNLVTGTVATAEVKDVSYESFLGLSDSVKLIEINLQSSAGNSTYTLKISKSYGWVQTLSFYGFPEQDVSFGSKDYRPEEVLKYFLAGLSNPKVGFQNDYWYKINDFNVGDEFHTRTSWCRKHIGQIIETAKRVLEKEIYSDSIVYKWHTKTLKYSLGYERCRITDTIYQEDTIRTSEGIYEARIFPDDIIQGYLSYKSIDSSGDTSYVLIYHYAQDYRLAPSRQIPGKLAYAIITGRLEKDSTDSCFFFKSPYLIAEEYAMGLGRIYSNYSYGPNSQSHYLLYYKKGTDEWGTPLFAIKEEPHVEIKEFKIYPNPTTEKITIELDNSSRGDISLINTAGVTLMKINVQDEYNAVLDLGDFPHGIYFLRFNLNNEIWIEKIVKHIQ